MSNENLSVDESSGYDSTESENDTISIALEGGNDKEDDIALYCDEEDDVALHCNKDDIALHCNKEDVALQCDEGVEVNDQLRHHPESTKCVRGYFTEQPFLSDDFDVLFGWQWGLEEGKYFRYHSFCYVACFFHSKSIL